MRLTPLAQSDMPVSGQLDAVVEDVWRRIERALDGSWPPWGLPMLATVAKDGPRARVLALRTANAASRTLTFHTDARSQKVGEIAADVRVCVVFWDPTDGIEARFTGTAVLHREDGVANAAWASVSPVRRLASRSAMAPGAQLGSSTRFDAVPASAEHDGRVNFTVVEVRLDNLDWLWVGADDMRRATFVWTGTAWTGAWTIP
jgi:pyridoxamine 5'-phosphate oxidase